jgi:hypothetical protein
MQPAHVADPGTQEATDSGEETVRDYTCKCCGAECAVTDECDNNPTSGKGKPAVRAFSPVRKSKPLSSFRAAIRGQLGQRIPNELCGGL